MPLPGFRAGSGEPLLLIHGLGGCWQAWDPVLPLLTGRHEVSAPDLPGFGTAAPLAGVEPTPGALADALERHLDDLGWDTAHIAGNSLGGLIALELGRRGRARTVTALSPGGMARGWEDVLARSLIRGQVYLGRALRPMLPGLARSALGRTIGLGAVAARPWRVSPPAAARLATAYVDSPVVLATLDAFDGTTTTEHLDDIHCPVTIGWGTRDRLLLPRQGERFRAALPAARLVRLPGLGHVPMSDDPVTVARLLLDGAARRTATAAGDRRRPEGPAGIAEPS